MAKQIDQHKKAKLILHDRDAGDEKEGWNKVDRYLLEIKDVDGKDRGIVGDDWELLVQTAKASIDARRLGPRKPDPIDEQTLKAGYIFGIPDPLPALPLHWSFNARKSEWLTANSPDRQLWIVGKDLVYYGVTQLGGGYYLTGEVNVY